MAQWATRAVAFLISLGLGLSASVAWNLNRAISLCEIDANPAKYEGKSVRLRVIVSNDNGVVSACSVCEAESAWPTAGLDLDRSVLRETHHTRGQDTVKYYLSEAIVVGILKPDGGFTHCFGPKHEISQARIERLVSNREFETLEQAVQWLKSKSR